MWVDTILFAARHHASHDDGAGAILGLLVIVVLFIVFAFRASTARYDLIQRNGLPYCPRCNRQVSLRREFCRACGYRFVTYGSSPSEPPEPSPAERAQGRSLRAWKQHLADEEARQGEEVRRRAAQEEAKRHTLAGLDIEIGDGPPPLPKARDSLMDRYRALSDLAQAAVIGLMIALPVVIVLVLAFNLSKADPPAPEPNPVLPAWTPTLPADATVYVTRRGTRYHKESCAQLVGIGMPLAFREAVRQFVPCRECWIDPVPAVVDPPAKPKADPEGVKPIAADVASPKADEETAPPPVVPGAPAAPAPVVAAPAGPAPPPRVVAVAPAPAPPPRVVVAAPPSGPPVRVPPVRAPRRDYRRTARVEYREDIPTPRAIETHFGSTPTGIPTYVGPRGGIYHYSPSGRKVYASSRRRR